MFDTVTNNGVAFSQRVRQRSQPLEQGRRRHRHQDRRRARAANTYNWVADAAGDPRGAFSTTLISPATNPGSDGRIHPLASFTGARGYRELRFADLPYIVGESRVYESYLMIDDQCSWQKVFDF